MNSIVRAVISTITPPKKKEIPKIAEKATKTDQKKLEKQKQIKSRTRKIIKKDENAIVLSQYVEPVPTVLVENRDVGLIISISKLSSLNLRI